MNSFSIVSFFIFTLALLAPCARAAEPAPPQDLSQRLLDLGQIQECETLQGQQEICGTWTWDRKAQAFNATWQNGVTAELKVEKMEGGEIVLVRRDLSGSSSGSTVRYFGFNAGSDKEGDTAVQLLKGTIVSGSPASPVGGTWHARSAFFLDLGNSEK